MTPIATDLRALRPAFERLGDFAMDRLLLRIRPNTAPDN
jgi:hypothetical protein